MNLLFSGQPLVLQRIVFFRDKQHVYNEFAVCWVKPRAIMHLLFVFLQNSTFHNELVVVFLGGNQTCYNGFAVFGGKHNFTLWIWCLFENHISHNEFAGVFRKPYFLHWVCCFGESHMFHDEFAGFWENNIYTMKLLGFGEKICFTMSFLFFVKTILCTMRLIVLGENHISYNEVACFYWNSSFYKESASCFKKQISHNEFVGFWENHNVYSEFAVVLKTNTSHNECVGCLGKAILFTMVFLFIFCKIILSTMSLLVVGENNFRIMNLLFWGKQYMLAWVSWLCWKTMFSTMNELVVLGKTILFTMNFLFFGEIIFSTMNLLVIWKTIMNLLFEKHIFYNEFAGVLGKLFLQWICCFW